MIVRLLSFFFFKQKTAYEMRISDWSSDVCSSDLYPRLGAVGDGHQHRGGHDRAAPAADVVVALVAREQHDAFGRMVERAAQAVGERHAASNAKNAPSLHTPAGVRSEEHTSELQSLMRISYAVFGLKKQKSSI